ncbi:unnamed protein product, partial [Onchocerca ochengi]|uniref:DUF2815 family protein n=1 Tax=Onchocerca ochengi TaxID=42157 RepID=A0A182EY15_ONCOC
MAKITMLKVPEAKDEQGDIKGNVAVMGSPLVATISLYGCCSAKMIHQFMDEKVDKSLNKNARFGSVSPDKVDQVDDVEEFY